MAIRGRVCLFTGAVLMATTGASCPRAARSPGPLPPVAFVQQPTLQQITHTVNRNTERVQQLQAREATLHVAGLPALSTSLALERPNRLRLQAGLGITGTELDLGSNDEMFWIWAKRSDPPALYYGRHQDVSPPQETPLFPVPPTWLIEALGLVQFNAQLPLEGPFLYAGGHVAVRSHAAHGGSLLKKTTVVDGQYGFVVEVHVHDQQGQLLAAAALSRQAYDSSTGVTLPQEVEIRLPLADMTMTLRTKGYDINQFTVDPNVLWSMPQMSGVPLVNVAGRHMDAAAPRLEAAPVTLSP